MPDNRPKPEIPAWQRAPITPATEDPVYAQPTKDTGASIPRVEQKPATPATEDPVRVQSVDEVTSSLKEKDGESTTEQAKAPIPATEDPVYAQPTTRDAEVSRNDSAEAAKRSTASQSFNATDVDNFRAVDGSQPSRPPPLPSTAAPPPIITYPEFLVNAHQPPPLITPTRVVNTLYAAGSLAALFYGGAKFLVEPMVASLSESRHDFYSHSQSKVDDFNTRLSKLVSKVPDLSKDQDGSRTTDTDDLDSITSDPTELYHRDMGTQTDITPPSASRKPTSSSDASTSTLASLTALNSLTTHLTTLLDSTTKNATTAQERITSIQTLRNYLDTLCYASSGLSTWNTPADKNGANGKSEDAVEELKKEIRNVKGVLLSAKRFPSYASTGYYAGGR